MHPFPNYFKLNAMKFFLSLILIAFCSISFAQGTTQEEYNYVTKGYKIQQESGLDMKKGYSIKLYPETQTNGSVNWNEKAEVVAGGLFVMVKQSPAH
ncbi:hypothetical protein [Haliscomenobacter sp.]|uniref:hypothetical protein n=1 Tax=Haliscomenobacter sp. TaxID=2717303 RepID=UPI003BAA3E7A